MTYHPVNNPTDLPPVNSVEDLDDLPWGGNAWWDLPIMAHVDKVVADRSRPSALRKSIAERAGFLMTGEDCTFKTYQEWLDYEEYCQ